MGLKLRTSLSFNYSVFFSTWTCGATHWASHLQHWSCGVCRCTLPLLCESQYQPSPSLVLRLSASSSACSSLLRSQSPPHSSSVTSRWLQQNTFYQLIWFVRCCFFCPAARLQWDDWMLDFNKDGTLTYFGYTNGFLFTVGRCIWAMRRFSGMLLIGSTPAEVVFFAVQ